MLREVKVRVSADTAGATSEIERTSQAVDKLGRRSARLTSDAGHLDRAINGAAKAVQREGLAIEAAVASAKRISPIKTAAAAATMSLDTAAVSAASALGREANALDDVSNQANLTASAARDISAATGQAGRVAEFAAAAFQRESQAIEAVANNGKRLSAEIRSSSAAMAEVETYARSAASSLQQEANALDIVGDSAARTVSAVRAVATTTDQVSRSTGNSASRLAADVDRLQSEFGILIDKQGRARDSSGRFVVMNEKLRDSLSKADISLNRIKEAYDRVGTAAKGASANVIQFPEQLDRVARSSGNLQRGIQNAAFQVGDFAVQVAAGTGASRALAMQLPQLLGGFGVMGAVLGAVVAIAIPLRTAMKGLSEDGQDLSKVFGTLQPVAQAVGEAFGRVGEFAHAAAELVVNNVDRILVTAGVAAAFFAGRWVASFVAARIATFSLATALTTLRGAIIKTGFGALIVGAGELVYQFTRLVKAAGGFGKALGLVSDVAIETWDKIKRGASLMGELLGAIAMQVQGAFVGAFASIASAFSGLTQKIADGMNALFGTDVKGIGSEFAAGLTTDADYLKKAGEANASSAAKSMQALGEERFTSIKKIRDLLADMKDERITLPSILGTDEDEEEGGKKKKTLDENLKGQEKRIAEHLGRIKALTKGALSDKLGSWGDYFSNLISLTGSNNERLLSIGKAFAAAQATVDAWSAFAATLRDPKLSWWQRIAAAGQVLAAGLGAVNSIRSVSGAGGGGGGGGAAGGSPTLPQEPDRYVSINVSGNTAASGEALIEAINSAIGKGYRIRGVTVG